MMMCETPKGLRHLVLFLIALALLPPAIIAFARTFPSKKPPIHYIQDMDNQAKFRAQQATEIYADRRAMRMPVPGTVAQGELRIDEGYETGRVNRQWIEDFPEQVTVDLDFIERGQQRFNVYCLPCHGPAGYGDGVIDKRAKDLLINASRGHGTSWVPPKNLHDSQIVKQPVGKIYNTITSGFNMMPAHGPQIPIDDRWAITAYVKALQRSQAARIEDVPADQRDSIAEINVNDESDSADTDG